MAALSDPPVGVPSDLPFNSKNLLEKVLVLIVQDIGPITDKVKIKQFLDEYEKDNIIKTLNKEAKLSPGDDILLVAENFYMYYGRFYFRRYKSVFLS